MNRYRHWLLSHLTGIGIGIADVNRYRSNSNWQAMYLCPWKQIKAWVGTGYTSINMQKGTGKINRKIFGKTMVIIARPPFPQNIEGPPTPHNWGLKASLFFTTCSRVWYFPPALNEQSCLKTLTISRAILPKWTDWESFSPLWSVIFSVLLPQVQSACFKCYAYGIVLISCHSQKSKPRVTARLRRRDPCFQWKEI